MSMKLIELSKEMVLGKISAEEFETMFFKQWREESNSGALGKDNKSVSLCLYDIFDLAERFTSDPDKNDIDIDETTLVEETRKVLDKFNFI